MVVGLQIGVPEPFRFLSFSSKSIPFSCSLTVAMAACVFSGMIEYTCRVEDAPGGSQITLKVFRWDLFSFETSGTRYKNDLVIRRVRVRWEMCRAFPYQLLDANLDQSADKF